MLQHVRQKGPGELRVAGFSEASMFCQQLLDAASEASQEQILS